MLITETHVFFWDGWLSNFYPSMLTVDGIHFSSSEQMFIYEKAMFFKDYEIASQILDTTDPGKAKKLGRKVKGYSDELWSQVRVAAMKNVLSVKFRQNQKLKQKLIETGNRILVEASPYDRIWGIGMAEHDPGISDESTWKGLNLLGKLLTEVREELKS